MLSLTRKLNQSVFFIRDDEVICVKITRLSKGQTGLAIGADRSYQIVRSDNMTEEQKELVRRAGYGNEIGGDPQTPG